MKIASIALAAVSAAAILSGSALAADLPPRGPAIAPAPSYISPAPMWSGFYVGVQAGWMWGGDGATEVDRFFDGSSTDATMRADYTLRALPVNQSYDSSGALVGLTAGWNYQMGSAVLGVEGDLSFSGLDGSKSTNGLFAYVPTPPATTNYLVTTTSSSSMDWFATLRARAGFLVTPATLLYATGGLAFGDVSASLRVKGSYYTVENGAVDWVSNASGGETRTGWTLGAGVEHKFSRNWSLKLEYLYYDLGDVTVKNDMSIPLAGGGFTPNQISAWKTNKFDFSGNVFRGGVNYQF
jgi:outer membrane immunogenic protein